MPVAAAAADASAVGAASAAGSNNLSNMAASTRVIK